ncbi:D-alanyl-D-alanine carboxypeptidase/D-alanyl-D-alanine-endopeptidase [Leptolyngbya boryana NIES-2135]|jgi:D-alanyl-D-alanine carboxypeptidase/D-alanyl-D-alanine-endopeptidase (penicillin-binding protein 4)|uniref:D-alanyl-D-alanine carboxypeptidase/D-alanyl-D-alanine-endopeptidase n=1 Tax=Leptolyngbya boryana NIES-2135 TaxID=1973484 RepID=A0A1Z4JJ49_LEPBY|nr:MULTISPECIES: D-alanyl-D-alanine carboxypeptidase/D-alanyl-D-alanine-endopeptidase [Leptolyngbya]BAY56708.1 D-alanyl-D-alanine carboxypeptidase/D-alanyl-D-alanine-endopeptidase [Leptolyngbya boryana NIES-2135]MBD2369455.1 D-alanyl-D-alanine carboxypeptidase/D-alanyl-D-alanine-endopeptidase [Leptolyngbya sp. FACHB-161]MBD2376800.1 D-alanyl-D-alanine carboxypeptidase/D-alanyl-D-alanine-endopeptidase [Leptolyngbya sp. FACHB-238]MBD2401167.1 D-alanyl-D-alanine carboxypeptidase/D-alanyl-D-alanine
MTVFSQRLIISLLGWFFLGLTGFTTSLRAESGAICSQQLTPQIDAIVNRPEFARSRFGVMIQTLDSRQTLYRRDADRFFIPASNMKLFTTAIALKEFSPNFRIRTSVYGTPTANGWRLRLVGRGDPSLSDQQLKEMVQQLKRRGIQRIAELTIEDSYFGQDSLISSWAVGDIQAPYAVPVNSLILNQNSLGFQVIPQAVGQPLQLKWDDPTQAQYWQIDNRSRTVETKTKEFLQIQRDLSQSILKVEGQLQVGAKPDLWAIAVPNPNQYFLRQLVRFLQEEKISVARSQISDQAMRPFGIEVAGIDSPPLSELVKETNTNSNNLFAEALLRTIGAKNPQAEGRTVLEKGLATVAVRLSRLGIESNEIELEDAAGLSRKNWSTPAAFVKLLQVMLQQPEAKYFRESLAIGGETGTLAGRFQDHPARGITQAKTGTLTGATALSGYITPPRYSPIAFSIIINNAQDFTAQRTAISEIVAILARLKSC